MTPYNAKAKQHVMHVIVWPLFSHLEHIVANIM